LTAGREGTPRAPSLQRGESGGVEKTGGRGAQKTERGRGTAERRRSPARSGQTFRGGSRRCCGTTAAQELDEDLPAALFSSFRRGDEFN